jgi:chaperonin cofactor prefoldin
MSGFDRIWNGLKSVVQLESDVARLTAKVEVLDSRERETRERLIYLEGVIAGARERAAATRPRLEDGSR